MVDFVKTIIKPINSTCAEHGKSPGHSPQDLVSVLLYTTELDAVFDCRLCKNYYLTYQFYRYGARDITWSHLYKLRNSSM